MRTRILLILALCGSALSLCAPGPIAWSRPASAPTLRSLATATTRPGLLFVENVGQFDARARFQVFGEAPLFLTDDALWLSVPERTPPSQRGASHRASHPPTLRSQRGVSLRLSFVGANPRPRLEPFDRLETRVSYFTGSTAASWYAGVPVWGGVRYRDLYPAIDLELASVGGQLDPRVILHSGADPGVVRLPVEGAESVAITGDALRLTTAAGDAVLPLPTLVAPDGGRLSAMPAADVQGADIRMPFARSAGRTSAAPQASTELIFGTYLGGDSNSDGEEGDGIAVDAEKNVYLTGNTNSSSFPTTVGAYARTSAGCDAFLVKLNPTGSELLYASFLGGDQGCSTGTGIALDANNHVYIAGYTSSPSFPTTANAYARSLRDLDTDAFVVRMNPSVSGKAGLEYATYFGGSSYDYAQGIALDRAGRVYIAGATRSPDFPRTPGAFDTTCGTDGKCDNTGTGSQSDAFVAKLNLNLAGAAALIYSTFLGGSLNDEAHGIAVAGTAAYVTGWTRSWDFPSTLNAVDPSYNGFGDAFLVTLNDTGSAPLSYATFLGAYGDASYGFGVAVDSAGAAYVVGSTAAPAFPTTPGAWDRTCGTDPNSSCNLANDFHYSDAFVAKLDLSAAHSLIYSTFLGGRDGDTAVAIAVDAAGNAFVAGSTYSGDFPTSPTALISTYRDSRDAFVVKLNAAGSAPLGYATFLGGTDREDAFAITIDPTGAAYVTGWTKSADFPTSPTAYKQHASGTSEIVFVTKLAAGRSDPILKPGPVYLPLSLVSKWIPPAACKDDIEDNDRPDQARPLTLFGQPCTGSFQDDAQGNDDYYRVDLRAGQTISAGLTNLPEGADYDLVLYNVRLTQLAVSKFPGSEDEHIGPVAVTQSGRYYIRVFMRTKSQIKTNTYVLRVDRT